MIRLKHSENNQLNFEKAEGNPKILILVWDELSKEILNKCRGSDVKTKYNILYAEYKRAVENKRTSGSEMSSRRYWDVFHNTVPKKVKNLTILNLGQENLHSNYI